MHKFILQATACLLFVLPLKAVASEEDWVVAKATAQVRYTTDKTTWHAVKAGMTIPNGAWMSTGPRARALLQRGVESVNFHPGTTASITTNSSRQTEVVQPTGTLDLDIEKRSAPHTRVDTPFLAAVVKGTKFSVTVSKKTADVAVSRGLVNVRSLQSAQQADVGPGQSASVGSGGGMQTAGKASAPTISRVTSMFGFLGVPTTSALAGPSVTAETTADNAAPSTASSANATGSDATGHSASDSRGATSGNGQGSSQGNGGKGAGGAGNGGKGGGESRDKAGNGKGPEGLGGPDDGPGQGPGTGPGPGPGKGPSGPGKGAPGNGRDADKDPGKSDGPGHPDAKDGPHGKGPGKPGGHGEHADNGEDGDHGGKGPGGKGENKGDGKAKGRDR